LDTFQSSEESVIQESRAAVDTPENKEPSNAFALAECGHGIIKNPSLEVNFTGTWHSLWAMQWTSTMAFIIDAKTAKCQSSQLDSLPKYTGIDSSASLNRPTCVSGGIFPDQVPTNRCGQKNDL
jgi:hypothetical protein